jgi:hypothetical protein
VFCGGLGIDVFLTEQLFLRAHAMYGIGLPLGNSEYDIYKYTHGLLAKIAVGWVF